MHINRFEPPSWRAYRHKLTRPVISKSITLAVCRREIQEPKKGETSIMVRIRNERTRPWSYQQGALPNELAAGLYTIPRKKTDFNNFSIIHLKYFPRSHSFYKNSRQQNICISLDCFSADVFSAMKRLFLSPRCTTSTLS